MSAAARGAASVPDVPGVPGVTFAPYRTGVTTRSRTELLTDCDRAMFHDYGPRPLPRPAGATDIPPTAAPLDAYARLIDAIAAMPHLDVVTLEELCHRPIDPARPDRIRLAIRHDVDGDLHAALLQAEIERAAGVPSSYYLLHTAAYHGTWDAGVFHRHRAAITIYQELQALGHEIALHTDALTVYQQYGVDGAAALTSELAWLREHDLRVVGSVAHGSKAAFGAENFEVFVGREKGKARVPTSPGDPLATPTVLRHGGRPALLHVLDEDDLGLTYEGNDVFFQRDVPVVYGAIRSVDAWRWNPHLAWRRTVDRPTPAFVPDDVVLRDLARLEPGCCVVLAVHPCYYGARPSPGVRPPRAARVTHVPRSTRSTHTLHTTHPAARTTRDPCPHTGWPTFPPRRPVVTDAGVISWSNADGMLAPERPDHAARRRTRVLLLGSDAFAGDGAGAASCVGHVLEELAAVAATSGSAADRTPAVGPLATRTLAAPGMGPDRLAAWLDLGRRGFDPTHVVIGIGPAIHRQTVPGVWSIETGFSLRHPPGPYAALPRGAAARDAMTTVARSRRWPAHRGTPRSLDTWPDTDIAMADALLRRADLPAPPGGQPPDDVVQRALAHLVTAARTRPSSAGAPPPRVAIMLTDLPPASDPRFAPLDDALRRVAHDALARAGNGASTDVAILHPADDEPWADDRVGPHEAWGPGAHRRAAAALWAWLATPTPRPRGASPPAAV